MTDPDKPRLTRQDVAGWLEGPDATARAAGVSVPATGYRGERLGLPESGAGSVAGFGRRFAALAIDWFAAVFVVSLLSGGSAAGNRASVVDRDFEVLAVFGLAVAIGVWLTGGSMGQYLLRLRVVRVDGTPLGLPRALLRTGLLCLAIPALIWDRDGRGLHDKAVRSVVVRAG